MDKIKNLLKYKRKLSKSYWKNSRECVPFYNQFIKYVVIEKKIYHVFDPEITLKDGLNSEMPQTKDWKSSLDRPYVSVFALSKKSNN